jgi:hypothetical protein
MASVTVDRAETMSKVVIADDHPLFREARRLAVEEAFTGEDKFMLETGSVDGVHRLAREAGDIDLVLLDLNMPGMDRAQEAGAPGAAGPAMTPDRRPGAAAAQRPAPHRPGQAQQDHRP